MDMTCALTIHNKQRVRDMSLPDRHVKIHVGLGTRILLNIASKLIVAITEPEESSKKRPNPDQPETNQVTGDDLTSDIAKRPPKIEKESLSFYNRWNEYCFYDLHTCVGRKQRILCVKEVIGKYDIPWSPDLNIDSRKRVCLTRVKPFGPLSETTVYVSTWIGSSEFGRDTGNNDSLGRQYVMMVTWFNTKKKNPWL